MNALRIMIWGGPLVLLWSNLVHHLAGEWSLNAQYSYGWAVPPLFIYLLWRKTNQRDGALRGMWAGLSSRGVLTGVGLGLGYAITRVVEESNPDWRLVSWALAIEVTGFSLLLLALLTKDNSPTDSPAPSFFFPFLFFLTAIPWPTMIEHQLATGLTATMVSCAVGLLSSVGIPAVDHGNLIETARGTTGIEEACSGIRSFQAALMVGLFFGEYFQLRLRGRVITVTAGLVLAVVLNLVRTTILAFLVSKRGLGMIDRWHDLMSWAIPVICFAAIWLLALSQEPRKANAAPTQPIDSPLSLFMSKAATWSHSWAIPVTLTTWIVLVEVGTETWYRVHEKKLQPAITWRIELPRNEPGFRELPFSRESRQILRYSDALNARWSDENGFGWQAIFLQWNPGRAAVRLARNHTPQDCLVASGMRIVREMGLHRMRIKDLEMSFIENLATDSSGPVYVFYCLWNDRAPRPAVRSEWLTYWNRLQPVLAGERNSGQRSLELALWGANDEQAAHEALARVLNRIICLPE